MVGDVPIIGGSRDWIGEGGRAAWARDVVEETGCSSTADVDLVRAARAGSRQAFDRLVARHAANVVRTAYVIVGDPDDANDVAQDAFISAYRGLDGYQPTAPFGAWLHRIAVNRSYDYLRRRQRRDALMEEIVAVSPGAEEDAAVRDARRDDERAAVRALLEELDPKGRAVVALRFLQDMSIKEVAATLDVPEGTVKRRLHDALKRMRARLTAADVTGEAAGGLT